MDPCRSAAGEDRGGTWAILALALALLALAGCDDRAALRDARTDAWIRAQPGLVSQEFIFTRSPTAMCHAATIAEVDGGLVAAWFGGDHEKDSGVVIWASRRDRDGTWSAPAQVADGVVAAGERYACWNPVLFQPAAGPLLLFYKVGPSPRAWWGMKATSADGGRTWTRPERLPPGILGPIKNKPVQIPNGDLLCPTSSESTTKPSKWQVHFERSSDLGATWAKTEPLNDGVTISAIQPSILFLGGDKLLAIGRTRQSHLFQIESPDGGKTWGPMSLGPLPNPNSGTDAVTLKDGRHLLIYNHTAKGRSPLNLAVSRDGKTWQAALVFESEPGEYSYPAIIQTGDGLVHCVYTWKRQRVKHAVIDPAKLAPREMGAGGEWPK
jgi:predicted neuraminidase